eukprot:TRINITY_DN38523_c0_g1_i1.p1 TRINITY_DN38523_c0_g1~~TRINITY_DN38523_c0_g1_i1.p1  ORF type:complete len:993 (+),score=200.82 TRINITY_DN38523_c0_g1_i1:261-3239(+)
MSSSTVSFLPPHYRKAESFASVVPNFCSRRAVCGPFQNHHFVRSRRERLGRHFSDDSHLPGHFSVHATSEEERDSPSVIKELPDGSLLFSFQHDDENGAVRSRVSPAPATRPSSAFSMSSPNSLRRRLRFNKPRQQQQQRVPHPSTAAASLDGSQSSLSENERDYFDSAGNSRRPSSAYKKKSPLPRRTTDEEGMASLSAGSSVSSKLPSSFKKRSPIARQVAAAHATGTPMPIDSSTGASIQRPVPAFKKRSSFQKVTPAQSALRESPPVRVGRLPSSFRKRAFVSPPTSHASIFLEPEVGVTNGRPLGLGSSGAQALVPLPSVPRNTDRTRPTQSPAISPSEAAVHKSPPPGSGTTDNDVFPKLATKMSASPPVVRNLSFRPVSGFTKKSPLVTKTVLREAGNSLSTPSPMSAASSRPGATFRKRSALGKHSSADPSTPPASSPRGAAFSRPIPVFKKRSPLSEQTPLRNALVLPSKVPSSSSGRLPSSFQKCSAIPVPFPPAVKPMETEIDTSGAPPAAQTSNSGKAGARTPSARLSPPSSEPNIMARKTKAALPRQLDSAVQASIREVDHPGLPGQATHADENMATGNGAVSSPSRAALPRTLAKKSRAMAEKENSLIAVESSGGKSFVRTPRASLASSELSEGSAKLEGGEGGKGGVVKSDSSGRRPQETSSSRREKGEDEGGSGTGIQGKVAREGGIDATRLGEREAEEMRWKRKKIVLVSKKISPLTVRKDDAKAAEDARKWGAGKVPEERKGANEREGSKEWNEFEGRSKGGSHSELERREEVRGKAKDEVMGKKHERDEDHEDEEDDDIFYSDEESDEDDDEDEEEFVRNLEKWSQKAQEQRLAKEESTVRTTSTQGSAQEEEARPEKRFVESPKVGKKAALGAQKRQSKVVEVEDNVSGKNGGQSRVSGQGGGDHDIANGSGQATKEAAVEGQMGGEGKEESKEDNLSKLTLPMLKQIAKEKGLKGYSKLKKADLVDLIQSS